MYVVFTIDNCGKQNRADLNYPQEATFTQANHAYVKGNVKINGKEYHHSTHLYLKNNRWVTESVIRNNNDDDQRDVYMVPITEGIASMHDVSSAARKTGLAEIPDLLNKAFQEIDQAFLQDKRTEAELDHLTRKTENLVEDIDAKEAELVDLHAKLVDLRTIYTSALNGDISKEYVSPQASD